MNSKHILVKSITLIVFESVIGNNIDSAISLIKRAVGAVKLPAADIGLDQELEIIGNLIKTLMGLCETAHEGPVNRTTLLQQLIIDCANDSYTLHALESVLKDEIDPLEARDNAMSITRSFLTFLREEDAKQILKDYIKPLLYDNAASKDINLQTHLLKMVGELEPYYTGAGKEDPGVVKSFSLAEQDKLTEVFETVKKRNEGSHGFRFGVKDLNKMVAGMIHRAKFGTIAALQHQHKTGFTLAVFRWLLMYNLPIIEEWEDFETVTPNASMPVALLSDPNTIDVVATEFHTEQVPASVVIHAEPVDMTGDGSIVSVLSASPAMGSNTAYDQYMARLTTPIPGNEGMPIGYVAGTNPSPESIEDLPALATTKWDPFNGLTPKRKPCMIRISTEDEIEDNMELLYKNIFFNLNKKMPNMSEVTSAEMSAYVAEKLTANGWHVEFMRVNPSSWTYQSFIQVVLELEKKGYEVHCMMVDYLMMIPTVGCETGGPIGNDRRDQIRRIRAWMSARNILFLTPWQLSPAATQLLRTGVDDFVKQLPDRNYYSGSSQISQEVDLEIFLHIEKVNGVSYLTVQRGKYRSPSLVEEKDKYTAMIFHPQGGIQDDYFGPSMTRKRVGGGDVEAGEDEIPFWAMG